MAQSVLLVPVPEAEFLVRPRVARNSPDQLPANPDDTIAHITVLAPFADLDAIDDGLLDELETFFADVLPFAFQLAGMSTFPGGVTYLAPEPARPFRQLTHAIARRFPEYPPYGGQFDDVVPHLTVPLTPGESLAALERELAPRLPVTAHAREAALFWAEPGASRTLATFEFGTNAA